MRRVPLRRVFEVVNGGTPTSEPENWDGDIPWATPIDLGRVNGGRIAETQRTLTSEGLRIGSSKVPAGSLVLSTRAPIGYVAETTASMAFNQGCRGLTPRTEVDIRYFRYQLLMAAEQLQARGQGSTFVELSTDNLASFPVVVPRLAEQRAIADYLDAETARIDSLVAHRGRQLELLRARRRAEIRAAVVGADLAREHVLDRGEGWPPRALPSGWRLVPVRYVSRVTRGASPRPIDDPSYFDDDGEYSWVRISDVTANGHYLEHTGQRLSELGASKSVKLEPGRLILSIAASVGTATLTRIRCCIHDGFVCFDDLRGVTPEYLYYVFSAGTMFEGLGKLGTQLNLNTDTIGNIRVPAPPLERQEAIVSLLDAGARRASALSDDMSRQIDLLLERRQALITAAVTGQLEIPGIAA